MIEKQNLLHNNHFAATEAEPGWIVIPLQSVTQRRVLTVQISAY